MSTYRLFFIADKSKSGLIKQISEWLVRLKNNTDKQLSDFLPEIPQETGLRLAILITDLKTLEKKLEKTINLLALNDAPQFSPKEKIFITNKNLRPGKTVFLFPGFGSEFPGMLTGTSSKFKVVSKWMNIFEELHNRTDNTSSIGQDEWIESLLLKKSYGVAEGGPIGSIASLAFNDILHTLNIKCDAMIGHSNGENAALISAGILNYNSKDQFLKILRMLSEFPELKNKNGVYLAVNNFPKKNLEELLEYYQNDVFLAMNNCPGQQVLFIKLDARESVIQFIKKKYGLVFDLTTDHPYHTKAFEESLGYLKPVYDLFKISKGTTPVYSCVNSTFFPDDKEGIRDLALRQWVEPVDFQKTIKTAYEEGARTFIEVGPNNRLSGFVADSLKGKNFLMVNSSKENTSALNMIIEMCAKLWVNNHTVDLSYFTKNNEFTAVSNRAATDSNSIINSEKIFEGHQELMQQFLKVNDAVTKSFLNKLNATPKAIEDTSIIHEINDLLLNGKYKKTDLGLEFIGTLDLSKQKLINDHSMGGALPVAPFTISLELLAEIGVQLLKPTNNYLSVFDSSGNKWLDFERSSIDLKIIANWDVTNTNEQVVTITVYDITDKNDSKTPAFQGKVKSNINAKKESVIKLGKTKNKSTISMSDFYKDHLFHGTCFKSMNQINYWNDQGVEAIFKMPDLSNAIEGLSSPEFIIPGPMLDSTGQLMAYWLYELGLKDYAIFPFQLGSFDQYSKFPPAGSSILCKAKISKESSVITGDFEFIDLNGNCIGRLNDFKLRIFIHDWIPPILMNRLHDGNPETLTADFLNEGGGIWKKILGKLNLKNKEYDSWLKSSDSDKINYLLELETSKFSSI
jgi:malonyl CoA-acyl carrier protein transacylase